MMKLLPSYDIVIIGGGHNGLVAAAYLSKAGKSVLLLEKNNYVGGATVSARIFPSFDAYISRYAYLVSLFPQKIIQDLGLNVEFRQRRIASFTPFISAGKHNGLLLSNVDAGSNKTQIEYLANGDAEGYDQLLQKQQYFAKKIWHSFLHPLKSKAHWQRQFVTNEEANIWKAMVEEPIGTFIENHVKSDILRGVILTDAKIGSYTHAHDVSLLQNRTYLYHVVGNESGEWRVPVGGMGALVEALKSTAQTNGTNMFTEATVSKIHMSDPYHTVGFEYQGKDFEVKAKNIIVNASPLALNRLLPNTYNSSPEDEGTAFKVNMLLKKLPKLKASVNSTDAFAGTFHINQRYSQLQQAYTTVRNGDVPQLPPCEIYCHTLTDSSILSDSLAKQGYHTLTLFGLDAPYSLFLNNPEQRKKQFLEKYLQSISTYLEEPLESCLAQNADGWPCIEAKSAWDLEQEVGLPQGNIFHKALSWFFAEEPNEEEKWGVETPYARLYLCGSSAKRGGAVSGITGHNAAMCILNSS